jgi:hypothetical protein
MKFRLHDRIRISQTHHWAQGATGTISEPPDFLLKLTEDDNPYEDYHRYVQGVKGPIEFFFVWFDEPQIDADGDGPYKGGEIEAEAIESLNRIH